MLQLEEVFATANLFGGDKLWNIQKRGHQLSVEYLARIAL